MKRIATLAIAPMIIAAAEPPLPAAEIDKLFQVDGKAPGCAVAVVDHGQLAFAKGYGLADLETGRPITPDTPFNIASMTKQFTGMAVTLLIADDKLREDDDIRKFLPELRDYGKPIRLANLLNHSSGLRNHMALAAFQPGDHLPSHAEALRLVFRQSALNFTPGTRHQYESPNYVLLAEIVARVSGMSFDQFVEMRILKPLGMAHSGYAAPDPALSYAPRKDGGFDPNLKVNAARGSSGLLASARDFAVWMTNYDRQSVGGKSGLDRLLSTSTLTDGTPITYRYGLIKEFDYRGVKGLTRIAHGGQTAFYRSAFSFFPGRGFGSVVLCNSTVDARGREEAISDAWMKRNVPAKSQPAAETGVPLPPGLANRLAGNYYSAEDDDIRRFVVRDDALKIAIFGQEYPLIYRGVQRFAFFDQGEFRFSDARDGEPQLTEAIREQARLHFARLPAAPAPDLHGLPGRYKSSDVDGEVVVEAKDDKLVLRYPAGDAELTAIGPDRFSGQAFDFNHVAFARDSAGRVSGLTLSVNSGITRLRFAKVE